MVNIALCRSNLYPANAPYRNRYFRQIYWCVMERSKILQIWAKQWIPTAIAQEGSWRKSGCPGASIGLWTRYVNVIMWMNRLSMRAVYRFQIYCPICWIISKQCHWGRRLLWWQRRDGIMQHNKQIRITVATCQFLPPYSIVNLFKDEMPPNGGNAESVERDWLTNVLAALRKCDLCIENSRTPFVSSHRHPLIVQRGNIRLKSKGIWIPSVFPFIPGGSWNEPLPVRWDRTFSEAFHLKSHCEWTYPCAVYVGWWHKARLLLESASRYGLCVTETADLYGRIWITVQ